MEGLRRREVVAKESHLSRIMGRETKSKVLEKVGNPRKGKGGPREEERVGSTRRGN